MSDILCFYHKDLDGICAASIVKHKFPDCECIGLTYEKDLPNLPEKGKTIYIVDYTFPVDYMHQLNEDHIVHWIDHHHNAISEVKSSGFKASGSETLDPSYSGAALTWMHFNRHIKLPRFIELVSNWDLWKHDDPECVYFHYGIFCNADTSPGAEVWNKLNNAAHLSLVSETIIREIVECGKKARSYQGIIDKDHVQRFAYVVDFEGHKALVANYHRGTSEIFDSIIEEDKYRCDVMIIYSHRKNGYKYSIRSNDDTVDVALIAKKYGGNGHRASAGFWHDTLLWET